MQVLDTDLILMMGQANYCRPYMLQDTTRASLPDAINLAQGQQRARAG